MVLLDTHVLLWMLDKPEMLSSKAREYVCRNDLAISIASLWEMAVKASLTHEERRLELDRSILEFAELCEALNIEILPITPADCEYITRLPAIHGDPFDRMIIAQATTRRLPIVTRDEFIRKYTMVETIW